MKNKVTLSIRKDYIEKGKKASKERRRSLSALMQSGLEERIEKERSKKQEALDFLANLIPADRKRESEVDWKKEIRNWAHQKHA